MIGKTRQRRDEQPWHSDQPSRTVFGQGCGVLPYHPSSKRYRHVRYPPPPALSDWVQHFWIEQWDIRGSEPETREVLPHPNVQCVFARGRSRIYGIQLQRFVRQLAGADRILGMTFRAGAFYPFFREPVFSIANQFVPAQQVFSEAVRAEDEILACRDDDGMVRAASRFLLAHLPSLDPVVDTAAVAVDKLVRDPTIIKVHQLAAHCGVSNRTLQRLFTRYVGATARSIVKRYRMHDALDRLSRGEHLEWATLSQDLGYFDQAHFINDFKSSVGCSPGSYLRRLAK